MRFLIARLIGLVLLLHVPVRATICYSPPPPCQEFWTADAVFLGTVIRVGPLRAGAPAPRSIVSTTTLSGNGREVVFRVKEAFRGVRGTTVRLYQSGSMADFRFAVGRTYFVYAFGDPKEQWFGGVSFCGRTRALTDAAEELAYARSVRNATAGGRIFGTAGRQDSSVIFMGGPGPVAYPATGSLVTARSSAHTAETTVDVRGNFEFKDLPEGQYQVSVTFPAEWEADPEPAKVFRGSCFQLDFRPRSSASVSGKLKVTSGALPRFASISLFPVETPVSDILLRERSAYAHENGVFEFKGVSEGRYYMALNVAGPPNTDSPYPPTYYPGVQDRARAEVIDVRPGVQRTNADIILPAQLVERDIEVQVLWSDGRPARGGYAYLRSPDHPHAIVGPNGVSPLDADAKVVLKGFQGYTYDVIGTVACLPGGPNGRDSKSLRVPDAPQRPVLRVVLEGSFCQHYPNGR